MENTPGSGNPVCSNCHLPLQENDAYCGHCGQKRYRRKLNLKDYLEDIYNFVFNWDNRLLRTFKALLFQPGELTRAYFAGEHQRYLSPVRVLLYSFLFAVPLMTFNIEINGTTYSDHFSSLRSALESWQLRDSLQDRLVSLQNEFQSDSVQWSTYSKLRDTIFNKSEDSLLIKDGIKVYIGDLLRKSPSVVADQYIPEPGVPWQKRWAFKKEIERITQIENPNQKMLSRVIYVAFIALPIAGLTSWLMHGLKRYNYLENLVMQNFLFCFFLWLLLLAWVVDHLPLSEFLSNGLNILSYLLLVVYAFLAHQRYFKGPVWLHVLRSVVMVIALTGLFLSSTLVVFLFGAYVF